MAVLIAVRSGKYVWRMTCSRSDVSPSPNRHGATSRGVLPKENFLHATNAFYWQIQDFLIPLVDEGLLAVELRELIDHRGLRGDE